MQTKLTISLDKEVIEQAKAYARRTGRSLSGLIENYLKVLLEKEKQAPAISPEIRKLQGAIKLPADFDYKKSLSDSLNKRFSK